jgi:tRNA1Val (adenine37-N6)-methyltransferase
MLESLASGETLDILCGEKLRMIQRRDGYRFSIDPLLLANFVTLKKNEALLDVGTGCGIIPIYLSMKGWKNRLVGIEIQNELHGLCLRNKALNNCENVEFVSGDARTLAGALGSFQVVVSNPPYVKERTGRKCPDSSRLVARSETTLSLSALMAVASSVLSTSGRLYLVYPAKRLAELVDESRNRRLEPKRLRFVHPRAGAPAILCLAECVKNSGVHVKVEPPLYVHTQHDYSDEVKTYYA